jgi:hypothetical protein
MSPFTRTWDAAYETDPDDDDAAKLYALELRNFKTDIRERMDIEHSWGTMGTGNHKFGVGTSAARSAAIPVPIEGNVWFNTTTLAWQIYSGGVWTQAGGAPLGYFRGCELSRPTGITVTVASGTVAAANGPAIDLPTAMTKSINVAWAAGDAAGGRAGALTSATWYHVFVLLNPTTGAVDAGFDTSLTAVNLLVAAVGYTVYRRVGSVYYIDGVSFIRDFFQHKDHFFWKAPPVDFVSSIASAAGGTTISLSVPTGLAVLAMMNLHIYDVGIIYLSSFNATDLAAHDSASPLANVGSTDFAALGSNPNPIQTNTSGQIRGRCEAGESPELHIATTGWIDPLP